MNVKTKKKQNMKMTMVMCVCADSWQRVRQMNLGKKQAMSKMPM